MILNTGSVIFAIICWVCFLIFFGIAIYAFKRKTPMHFWSGTTIKEEEIKDINSYNRENGIMWLIYSSSFLIAGILALFKIEIATILLIVFSTVGLGILIYAHQRIYNKYKDPNFQKTQKEQVKLSKGYIVIMVIAMILTFGFIGGMIVYGAQDAKIEVSEKSIQIRSMYGISINFSEIEEVVLIEKSMEEIGVGRRTNGYGGLDGTLKGHFKSNELGAVLLFVKADSSPTIMIKRFNKKTIYISFSNSDKTRSLYEDIINSFL